MTRGPVSRVRADRCEELKEEHASVGPRVACHFGRWDHRRMVGCQDYSRQRACLVGDAAIGIVGALIGDWLLHRLGVHFGSGIIGLVINATIGAIVLLLPLRLMGASGWGSR
jgi:uncharacterized membrane protein YeaQ/YmgE (transglycosylase-associated protein family)